MNHFPPFSFAVFYRSTTFWIGCAPAAAAPEGKKEKEEEEEIPPAQKSPLAQRRMILGLARRGPRR